MFMDLLDGMRSWSDLNAISIANFHHQYIFGVKNTLRVLFELCFLVRQRSLLLAFVEANYSYA